MKTFMIIVFCAMCLMFIGCSANSVVPLPHTAHDYTPDQGKLPANQIAIAFPATDQFSNGTERWGLEWVPDAVAPAHLVLKASWSGKESRDIAVFQVNGVGVNPTSGEVSLGGKVFTAISVNVNSTDIPHGSGWIVLQEK
jgi:hypothetical protein